MAYTNEELDKLCGESPKFTLACTLCPREVGPYHYRLYAAAALEQHYLFAHNIAPKRRGSESV